MNRLYFWPINFIFWIILSILGLSPCQSGDSSPDSENVTLSLISEKKSVGQNPKIWIGLRVQLVPGWKTYWRSPGVAGYGVRLNWEGLENIKAAEIHWPLPHHFQTEFGTVNVYEGDFVLPISVEVLDLSKPIQGMVKANMLICNPSLCVPVQQTLHFDLPPGPGEENTSQAFHILKARSQVPITENHTSLQIEEAEVSGSDIPPTVRVRLSKPGGFSPSDVPELFMEIKDYFLDAPLAVLSNDHGSVLYSAFVYPNENRIPSALPNLVGMPVKLTVGLHNQGFETERTLKAQSLSFSFFVGLLLVAFIGGLILNIMPCVLPVLSLKVLSVMRQGGRDYKHIRQEFIATVFGIIFSFFILALGEISLKESGHALGWGVQFQEPAFVIGLVSILTLFSASLFGFFEFRLPNFLSSIGGIKPHQESLVGSFLEGSLVTLLATPCTAPLVGTALAFSLSRGPFEIISIFCMMGLGLAFPFLLMALFPSLAAKLPKPGMWMVHVKKGLGVLLILTTFWLLFVLKGQIGMKGTTLVTVLMALVLVVLANARLKPEWDRRIAWLVVGVLITGSLALSLFSVPSKPTTVLKHNALWQPFKADQIPKHIKAGKIVFVNVTADWCLTCQVNKYFTLKNQAVLEILSSKDVIAMEADWTNHNPEITRYLENFHQYGIPFYAIYGCRNPKGTFLGSVLTPQKVMDALNAERCGPK